mmetsp:Transcript_37638/g.60683  ORF Transcript_37638/g.60683 Transcript_37638/m.60683 type:complete len:109 (-) Transcript_37638:179-505(-)
MLHVAKLEEDEDRDISCGCVAQDMKLPVDTHTCTTRTFLGIDTHGMKGTGHSIRRVYALSCFSSGQVDKLSMNAKVTEGLCARRPDMTCYITYMTCMTCDITYMTCAE